MGYKTLPLLIIISMLSVVCVQASSESKLDKEAIRIVQNYRSPELDGTGWHSIKKLLNFYRKNGSKIVVKGWIAEREYGKIYSVYFFFNKDGLDLNMAWHVNLNTKQVQAFESEKTFDDF